MLIEPMMEKLIAMRLHGMVEVLKAQQQDPNADELTFNERLPMLIDQQWNWKENQALARRMKAPNFAAMLHRRDRLPALRAGSIRVSFGHLLKTRTG